jgi:DNA-binding NtrC family response regulator
MTAETGARGLARSVAMQAALEGLHAAVSTGGDVLLRGEQGTGGEEFARAIHLATDSSGSTSVERLLRMAMLGQETASPFIAVDCASSYELETRLFGRPNRAKAVSEHDLEVVEEDSAVCQALGGTLLLGQITEIPGRLQVCLARVLRDGEVIVAEAGETTTRAVKLRLMATVEPLHGDERIVPELRRRLTQHKIDLPALRDRREDIPALVRYTLEDICAGLDVPVKTASKQAAQLLAALPWRGNLNELRDVVRAVALRTPGAVVRLSDVLASVRLDGGPATFTSSGPLKQARERFEREYVASVLAQHDGRMAEAARALGIQRTNLYRKVRQLSVTRERRDRMKAR